MGREVRMVPADWQHPRYSPEEVPDRPYLIGAYKPLFDGGTLKRRTERWDENARKWDEGFVSDFRGGWEPRAQCEHAAGIETYAEYDGERPDPADYMPEWPDEQRTHVMMYEDTSEGTPISPGFATAEELARWLADNGADAFGGMTANYEAWLATIKCGFSVGMVVNVETGECRSGVEANLSLSINRHPGGRNHGNSSTEDCGQV